jgi:serine/threonine protein kinase
MSGSTPDDDDTGQAQLRPFFSFASFVLQINNPQIIERLFGQDVGKDAILRVLKCKNTTTEQDGAAKAYNKKVLMRATLGDEERLSIAMPREIEVMNELSHRYVLPIIKVIEDDCSNSLIIILPFAHCGTLQSFVDNNPMDEVLLAICFFKIAEALRCVHSQKVAHGDLKPESVLVFNDRVFSLSDFSVSTKVEGDDQKLADTRGSPAFLSPEECVGEPFYPNPAEVWAYSVTLFAVAFGFLPFRLDQGQGKSVANTVFAVTQLLNSEELVVPEDRGYGPEFIDLIKQILKKNPMERPTFEDIVKNSWFTPALEIDAINIEEDARRLAAAEEEQQAEEDQGEDYQVDDVEVEVEVERDDDQEVSL